MAARSAGRVARDASGRRVAEVDPRGVPLAELAWAPDGRLARARLRLADDAWLVVEPRATTHPAWGPADRLSLVASDQAPSIGATRPGRAVGGRAPARADTLARVEAIDWHRIDRIPTLDEPARLPPGAGTTLLNLLAQLAEDQGSGPLSYPGPYPGEHLFLSLLESFRYTPECDDPLAALMAGTLAWTPAPHARERLADGLWLHRRAPEAGAPERIEKVLWRGRAYYRPDWQGVRRHAPLRVRDVPGGLACSLWALGTALEDHARFAHDGSVLEITDRQLGDLAGRQLGDLAGPPDDPEPPQTMAPAVLAGVAALVAARSVGALAPHLAETARELAAAWGPAGGGLVLLEASRLVVTRRLAARLGEVLAHAPDLASRRALGLAALSEIAHAAGDGLRARAQARLAALPEARQAAAMAEAGALAPGPADAAAIAEAVEALLAGQGTTGARDPLPGRRPAPAG